MKRTIPAILGSLILAGVSYAQPGPPPDGGPGGPGGPEGNRPPPPRQNDDRGGPGERRDGPGDRRDGPGDRRDGPQGRGPQDGPQRPGLIAGRPGPLEMMKNFLDLVEKYNTMSKDADATAVAAIINTVDIMRPRGPQAIIDRLEKTLTETKNPGLQRVIRLQLADFYRQTNQADKALEHLDVLIKGASAESH